MALNTAGFSSDSLCGRSRSGRRGPAAWVALLFIVGGCSCGDDGPSIQITAIGERPVGEGGELPSLTFEDDENAGQAGFQVAITASSSGIASTDAVELFVDDESDPIAQVFPDAGGNIIFRDVTLPLGTHRLRVRDLPARAEDEQDYLLSGLIIVTPMSGASLMSDDDVDGETEGLQFDVEVEVGGIDDGEDVSLSIDGEDSGAAPVAVADAVDGVVTFRGVDLPDGTITLQASAGMVDSQPVTVIVQSRCASITYVTPEPASDGEDLMLGPAADEDGEACGDAYTLSVQISTNVGDGQPAELFVNGTSRGIADISGTLARFDEVVLDNRGDQPNTMRVEVTNDASITCVENFPSRVMVDCDGPSCAITAPTPDSSFLNTEDDTSSDPGFQGAFEVTTDETGAEQDIALVIDGDDGDPLTATPMAVGMGGVASFTGVELAEGEHTFQAQCADANGNMTRSAELTWTVDTMPCEVAITDPSDGQEFNDTETVSDDVDSSMSGLQIAFAADVTGSDCEDQRVGACDSLSGEPFVVYDDSGAISTNVTLSSDPEQSLCVQVRDAAGNVNPEERVDITVRTEDPQLVFDTPDPATGGWFNVEGGTVNVDGTDQTFVADLDTGTFACDAMFVVDCSELDQPVELHVDDSTDPPAFGDAGALGTATCSEDSASSLAGRATFASLAIPTSTSNPFNLVALQQDETGVLSGRSTAVTINHDCRVPSILIDENDPGPLCGETLSVPPGEDTIDRTIRSFFNETVPQDNVVLKLDGTVSSVGPTPISGGWEFVDVTLSVDTTVDVLIEGIDDFGNLGTSQPSPCTVTIANVPTLEITEPPDGSDLGPDDDCGPSGGGYGITVSGTTDASDGTDNVEITVGSLSPVTTGVTSGAFSACVPAEDGVDVVIEVQVTEPDRDPATKSVTVDIDTAPPENAITDLALNDPSESPRTGIRSFTWTAVEDQTGSGQPLEHYRFRCDTVDSGGDDEAWWDAADVEEIGISPSSPGSTEVASINAPFFVAETYFCMVRGEDAGGNLTPTGNIVEFTQNFRQHLVRVPSDGNEYRLGNPIEPVGDVNGDGLPDVLAGAFYNDPDHANSEARAYLIFGTSSVSSAGVAPDVELTGPVWGSQFESLGFGQRLVGLGDFNGDTRPDFAISASSADAEDGRVYVFYGRASDDPWPASIDVTTGDCGADVCFATLSNIGGAFGDDVGAAGDFDGDGTVDLIAGEQFRGLNFEGRVYVILGRTGASAYSGVVETPANTEGFLLENTSTERLGFQTIGLGDTDGDTRGDIAIQEEQSTVYLVPGRDWSGPGMETIDPASFAFAHGQDTDPNALFAVGDVIGDANVDFGLRYTANDPGGEMVFFPGDGSGGFSTDGADIAIINETFNGDVFAGITVGGFLRDNAARGMHPVLSLETDLDGDGKADVLAGSEQLKGTDPGAADFFYASLLGGGVTVGRADKEAASDPNAGATLQLRADQGDDSYRMPRAAQFIGDFNGDGFPDLAVGDPRFDADLDPTSTPDETPGPREGRVLVLY